MRKLENYPMVTGVISGLLISFYFLMHYKGLTYLLPDFLLIPLASFCLLASFDGFVSGLALLVGRGLRPQIVLGVVLSGSTLVLSVIVTYMVLLPIFQDFIQFLS